MNYVRVEKAEIEYMLIDSKSQKIVDGAMDKCEAKGSLGFYRIFANVKEFQNSEKEILLCFKITTGFSGKDQTEPKLIDATLNVFPFGMPDNVAVKLE